MSLVTNLQTLATRIATEFKTVYGRIGNLTALDTTTKTDLVAAINEVNSKPTGTGGATINDAGTSTTTVWSSSKTNSEIGSQVSALVASAPTTLDTLDELAAALGDDPNFATTITTALGNRVRVDAAQAFTGPQQAQARTNIGAGTSDLTIGTTGTTAKAGDWKPAAADITDSTATGRSVITATDAAAARTAIGAGTSNLTIGTTSTTAKAGDYTPPDATTGAKGLVQLAGFLGGTAASPTVRSASDTQTGVVELATTTEATTGTDTTRAVTPAGLKAGLDTKANATHTHAATDISDSTATGRAVLTAVDAAAARTAIGAGTSNLVIGTSAGTAADAAAVGDTTTNFVTTFEAGLV